MDKGGLPGSPQADQGNVPLPPQITLTLLCQEVLCHMPISPQLARV